MKFDVCFDAFDILEGGMAVRWPTLTERRSWVQFQPGPFCVEFVCSPCAYVGPLASSVQRYAVRLTGNSKLSIDMSVCVWMVVSFSALAL